MKEITYEELMKYSLDDLILLQHCLYYQIPIEKVTKESKLLKRLTNEYVKEETLIKVIKEKRFNI